MTERQRCSWANNDPLEQAYHDDEWGVVERDGRRLFVLLMLESFQSGLSWLTILRKREGFRLAFADWDIAAIAAFDDDDVARLLNDAGIVRHRGKIEATIANARAWLEIEAEGGFSELVWSFVGGEPQPGPARMGEAVASDERSAAMARELKRRGMHHVGPTTCYSFMQAAGMIDDHEAGCFRITAAE